MGFFDIFKRKKHRFTCREKEALEETSESSHTSNPNNSSEQNLPFAEGMVSAENIGSEQKKYMPERLENAEKVVAEYAQCDPAPVEFERKQTTVGSLATSYKIVVGGYDESMLSASAVKFRGDDSVSYVLCCTQHANQLYITIIAWIERNYNMSLFSVPLFEDYWDAWDPNAEQSRYSTRFQIDDCKLELWQDMEFDTVGLKKESGTDDVADAFVARLLHGVMAAFEE